MVEQRQFHRVKLTQKCALAYQDVIHHGQLENISLNGAVISFEATAVIPVGVIGLLTVFLEEDVRPLKLNVEVIHGSGGLIGVKFVPLDEYGQNCLVHLVQQYTTEADKLISELDSVKWHIANYLRRAS